MIVALPIFLFLIVYIVFTVVGVVGLVWGPTWVDELLRIYTGVSVTQALSDESRRMILYVLTVPVLSMIIGYFSVFFLRSRLRINFDLKFKSEFAGVVLFLLSVSGGLFSVVRSGAIANLPLWLSSYDQWVTGRWLIFSSLTFFEFVNLYVVLPSSTAFLSIHYIFVKRKWPVVISTVAVCAILTLCLFMKKQLIVMLFILGTSIFLYQAKRNLLRLVIFVILIGFVFSFAVIVPTMEIVTTKVESLVKRGNDDKESVIVSKVGTRGEIIEKYFTTRGPIERLGYLGSSIFFRNAAPSIYYILSYPHVLQYEKIDVPLDGKTARDNLDVWNVMWPTTPGGSVMVPMHFAWYAQGGLGVSTVFSFFTGIILAVLWWFYSHNSFNGRRTSVQAALVLLYALFLATDSAKFGLISSYGVIWGFLFLDLGRYTCFGTALAKRYFKKYQ